VPTCNSGVEGDVNHEACEAFCSADQKGEHCGLCKCRGCGFCSCSSAHEDDSPVQECQPWCNGDYLEAHCDYCACQGCRFCRVGGKACQSFFLVGDFDHEACEPFCNEQSKDAHCGMCKCKQCGFCRAEERAKLPGGAASGPQCFSGLPHDADSEKCESFCSAEHKKEHCGQCKCKACNFCGEVCDSGIPADAEVAGCSAACHLSEPAAVCPLCKCRGCAFCAADGSVSEEGIRARAQAEAAARAIEGGCVPASAHDSDTEQCEAHCAIADKAKQCDTCKCSACDFCRGFEGCESGRAGDVKWVACDAKCDGPGDCELCGCRGCARCKSELARPRPACHSGVLGDTSEAMCVLGLCHASDKAAHCQTCRCQACSWCQATAASLLPAPPPRAVAHSCDSGHLGDALEPACEAFCTDKELSSGQVCGLCACRSCGRCRDASTVSTPPVSTSAAGEGGCPLALELNVLSSKREEADSVLFELAVRLSEWQPGAVVSVDFAGSPSKVHIDKDDVTGASLLTPPPANGAFTFSFRLGPQPGPLQSFSFTAFTDREHLDAPRPRLGCSNTRARPPPSPPRPPPPPPPWQQHQCALGGRFVLGQTWSGGSSFRAQVVLALWRPGATVTLDFRQSGGVGGLAAAGAEHATLQKAPYPGSIRVSLGAEPGPDHSFSLIAHGGAVGRTPPLMLCSLPGDDGGKETGEQPSVDESCLPLTPLYRVINSWQGGFKAAVALSHWQPGAKVTLRWPNLSPQLLDAWSAVGATATGGSLFFTLGATPDPEYNGFTFTSRGNADAAAAPTLNCVASASAAATVDVPPAACGMGASYSILPEGAPEAAAWRVRVHIHQWEPGARVDVTFSPAVVVVGPSQVRALDGSRQATQHAFDLEAQPDKEHGFSFSVRTDPGASAAPRLVRMGCRPPPRADAVEEAGVVAGAPEPPRGLAVSRASCNHLEVSWLAAVDNGLRVLGYTLTFQREDAAEGDEASLEAEGVGATLGGLAGGTTYLVRVRARNAKGASRPSAPFRATTDSGGAPLVAPVAPKPYRSLECGAVAFELPTLRAGCRGDGFLTLEGRSLVSPELLSRQEERVLFPHWSVLVARTAGTSVVVRGLAPYDAAEFRLTPHNKDGAGPASATVGPLLTDTDADAALSAPRVLPTSSASFALAWDDLAGGCRERMRWRVSVLRDASHVAEGAWEELASEVEGTGYEAFPVRCPPPGCLFRVQPVGIRGLDLPSEPSAPATSLLLAAPHAEAVRLQLVLTREQTGRDGAQLRALAAAEVCARVVAGRYYKGHQTSATPTRFRPLFGLHD